MSLPVWRLIDSGPGSPSFNMALDEALAISIRNKSSPPTLRLYGWSTDSVSIGYFQKASDINLEYCTARDIPLVRRPTGGRAILHGQELTYSFSVRTDISPFSKSLRDSYEQISRALAHAFREAGIAVASYKKKRTDSVHAENPLCFSSRSFGELHIENKKVVGSAQKRWPDSLLQQGSIPHEYNEDLLRGIFGDAKASSLRKSMIALTEVKQGIDKDEFKKMVAASFEKTFGIRFLGSRPSQEETRLARDLEYYKYSLDQWNLRH